MEPFIYRHCRDARNAPVDSAKEREKRAAMLLKRKEENAQMEGSKQ